MSNLSNIEQMKIFDAKQSVTGKIFDFIIEEGKVGIQGYYDRPGREKVIIPNFVSFFRNRDEVNIFMDCKYVNYLHFEENIEGSLTRLFNQFKGDKLSLDIDTRNITDMDSMFTACRAKEIDLGNKFDTSNTTTMQCMFSVC